MSVVDVLGRTPGDAGRVVVVAGDDVITRQELERRVDAWGAQLGVPGGDAVGVVPLVVDADVDSIVALLALWRSRCVPAPLNSHLTSTEVEAAREALDGAPLPPGTQVVLWTSGTSGRPRGVALSWANLEASARGSARRLALGPDDVWVASLSPAHVGGLALVTRSLLLGGTLVVPQRRDVEGLSRLLDGVGTSAFAPTHLSLVPTQLLRVMDHRGGRPPPETLRCVLIGGAHAPVSLVARACDEGWPIALTYGATEMSSQIATAPPDLVRSVPGTVGRPLPGVEVDVSVDGEILARGATQALGYVGAVGGRVEDPASDAFLDEDGWYRTGDLGRIDEDGQLWITGRRIDRIVSGGVTVDAVEVEEALRSHPTVLDACVVGIPDEEWGERVGAWVEPVVGEFDLEELERYLRAHLAPAKLPRRWRIDGALPRNANGKADRQAIRAALRD